MRLRSAWKLWNRLGGKPGPPEDPRTEESETPLSRAWQRLRTEPVRIPSWEKTEQLILTGKKEQPMSPVSRAGMFAFTRKAALIGAASAAVLLAFFAIPFSQSNPLGANIVFEFAAPTATTHECCAGLNISDVVDDPSWGITECNVRLEQQAGGSMTLELLVLTENGIVPGELVNRIIEQNPFLADAQVTVNPVTEQSSGTMFDKLTGKMRVSVDCEGKTAEEIKAEIESALLAEGVENPNVKVETIDDGGQKKVKICVGVDEDK